MKTLRQILQGKGHGVVSVSPDATVYDALMRMAEKEVGAVLVLEGERLVGVFSERDYARKTIPPPPPSKVLWVKPTQTVEECMALMTDKHVRHLPVLQDDRVIGVISIGDAVKEMLSEQQFIIEQLEHYIHG